MSLNIIKVEEQVNHGDHAQDVTIAIDPIPGETVDHLALRALSQSANWPATGTVANPAARVIIRATEGHEFPDPGRTTGVTLIGSERLRQIAQEGYDAEHDAGHADELAMAGATYAIYVASGSPVGPIAGWPWAPEFWKPTGNPIRDLTKAGALIAAALDSLLAEEVEPL